MGRRLADVLEHAPSDRRGFYGSLVQVGFSLGWSPPSGSSPSSPCCPKTSSWPGAGASPSSSASAGGRWAPSSAPHSETPVFEAIKAKQDLSSNPFYEAVFKSPRAFLVALGLKLLRSWSWVYMLDGVRRGLRHDQARLAAHPAARRDLLGRRGRGRDHSRCSAT